MIARKSNQSVEDKRIWMYEGPTSICMRGQGQGLIQRACHLDC